MTATYIQRMSYDTLRLLLPLTIQAPGSADTAAITSTYANRPGLPVAIPGSPACLAQPLVGDMSASPAPGHQATRPVPKQSYKSFWKHGATNWPRLPHEELTT